MDMFYLYLHSIQWTFKFLWNSLFDLRIIYPYLEVCCSVSKHLVFFCYLSIIDFLFDSTVIREHTLYDFNSFKFGEVCFVVQDMVGLGICSVGVWKEHVFCCYLVECSINADWVIVLLSSSKSLLNFCPFFNNNYWKNGLEVSDCNHGFVYFSFQFYQFHFKNFAALLFGAYTYKISLSSWMKGLTLSSLYSFLSISLVIFLAQKITFLLIHIAQHFRSHSNS